MNSVNAILEHTPRMQSTLGVQVCRMRFFGCVKHSKVCAVPMRANNRVPSAWRSCWVGSKKSRGLVISHRVPPVLAIDRARNVSQVDKPVIGLDSIDVVNVVCRPNAVNVQPRKPMRLVENAVYRDHPVSLWRNAAGLKSRFETAAFASCDAARKESRVRIVIQKLAQSLRGYNFRSHDAPPVRWDQRLGSVTSAGRASLF